MHDASEKTHAKIVFDLMIQHRRKLESIITNTLRNYWQMKDVFNDVCFDGISAALRNYDATKCSDFDRYMFYNVHFYAKKLQSAEYLQHTRFRHLITENDLQLNDDEMKRLQSESGLVADTTDSNDDIERMNCALDAIDMVSILIPLSRITEFELHIVTYHISYDMTFEDVAEILDYPASTVRKYFNIGMAKLRRANEALINGDAGNNFAD